jgi:hypothetical protein
MRNNRSTKNDNTRAMVSQQILVLKDGQQFRSMDIANILSRKHREISARTIGKLLQERQDVVLVNRCMSRWEKRSGC